MSPFWKDILREIKNSAGTFVSLLIIAALGAASVVGIQAAAIDMRDVADRTYKDNNLYDIQLKSAMGFDGDDIAALRDAELTQDVMPAYILDFFLTTADSTQTVRAYSLPDGLNRLTLLEGRLPAAADECVVESDLMTQAGYELGDSLVLWLEDADEYQERMQTGSFTIVGVVSSPLYLTIERGNTTLGDGKLSFYLYLHPSAFKLEVYTDVYVRINGSDRVYNLSEAYNEAAAGWEKQLKTVGDGRVLADKAELEDSRRELDEGFREYYDGLRELEEALAKGRAELDDARARLDEAYDELVSGQRELDVRIAAAQREINENAARLSDAQAEVDAGRVQLLDGRALLEAKLDELGAAQTELDGARRLLTDLLAQLELIGPRGVSAELDAQYAAIDAELLRLDAMQAELSAGLAAVSAMQAELDAMQAELDAAQAEIDGGASQISAARAALNRERASAQAEIDDGWAKYYEGVEECEDGEAELREEEAEARAELLDARVELLDAQRKLDDAPEPEWYYFTREDGVSFDSYYQDTLRLQKVGYVFPLVFLLVAVLVSLTSMSRMVEEHRTQIGVYKALGYRPAAIVMKYLIYALGSSLTGGVLGALAGSYALPRIITDAYGHLYDMPPVATPIPTATAVTAVAASVLSVMLVTAGSCAGTMRSSPALLMRPKAPAAGKRVLLERIGFFWNRLGFIGKVTARNIFRYKKRFFMTLVGIVGCTALLLTAFGLRDSISGVARLQYEEIVKYSDRLYLKDIKTDGQYGELSGAMPESSLFFHEETADAEGPGGGMSASVIVPLAPGELNDFLNLYSPKSGEAVPMPQDGVLVTEKLARVMDVAIGDSFDLAAGDNKSYRLEVTGIVENYVLHYIYMPPQTYLRVFGSEPVANGAFLKAEGEELQSGLLKNSDVMAVLKTESIRDMLSDSTDALGVVTVVLLVLACALAFIVLFNLSSINISERLRELATVKVLGFTNMDTAVYIFRENAAVTAMGIALGLVAGVALTGFVLTSVEIDLLKFPKVINVLSYVYSVALSCVFAVFVNLVMIRRLRAIDMVESLKSVE